MILKVSDPGISLPDQAFKRKDWIFDNLERINFTGPIEVDLSIKMSGGIEEPPDYRLACGIFGQPLESVKHFRISCLTRSNDEFVIISGYEAFIMNDEGKTIEILR